jgi:hypothetical protein
MMVNMEYHKGSFCEYASVFCQEGYCSGCAIYLRRPPAIKQFNPHEVAKSRKAPKLVLVH